MRFLLFTSRLAAVAAALIAPALWGLDPNEKPSNFTASYWDTELGLPHNAIKTLFQTSDGYLWIGTNQGLARFDGLKFTTFTRHTTPGLNNNQITSFAETADGSLWIGTSSGLTRYFRGEFTTYTAKDGLKTGETVNTVCVAEDGSLWIGGRSGITRWVNGQFVNDLATSGLDLFGMRSIMRARSGAMWVSVGTGGLRYQSGRFTAFDARHGLPKQNLQCFVENPAGDLIAVTQTGLFRLEGERFVPWEHNAELGSQKVSTAAVDRAGNFWIGTALGLDRYVGDRVAPYTDHHGQRPGIVDALLEDREGSLWMGTGNGLYRLVDRRAYSWSNAEGIAGSLITAVTQTRDGAVWVSSWANGADRFFNGEVTHLAAGAPLSHSTVTFIYQAPDGAMWLGNRGSSIDRLEGGKATSYVYPSGVATSRPVTAVHADSSGRFLLGIASRGLLELRDEKIQPAPEAQVLNGSTVWLLRRLRNGRLVAGTTKGFFEQKAAGQWTLVEWRGVPQPLIVRDLLEANDGTIWLATDGQGLVRWRAGETRSYGTRQGMVDDTLFAVLDDDIGSLWVCSSRGMARFRHAEIAEMDRNPTARLDGLVFGRADGLLSGSSSGGGPTAVKLSDGRLMMATDNGVAVIDPRRIQLNPQPPTVVIESVVVDERKLPTDRAVVIPPDANRVEIQYTALSLVAPQRLRFRYQLQGSDPGWIEAGHERSARYTHLDPGTYLFQVLACNNDGVWNDTGAVLGFVVQPHYYQTLWFKIVAGLAAAGGLLLLVGLRVRKLARKQRDLARANAELDLRVRERTAELSQSNEELQQRELLFRLIFEHAPVGISWHRADLGGDYHFNAAFRRILDLPGETLPDTSVLTALTHPDDAARQAEKEASIRSGGADSYTLEQRFVRKDGRLVWGLLAGAVVRDRRGEVIQVIGLLEDITARKEAEQELAATHQRLMEASRFAGMADVATGVLHNVGNVLNSVNVSAEVLKERLRAFNVERVGRLAALLREHAGNLAAFFTENPKGAHVTPYLETLASDLSSQQKAMLAEVQSLRDNVEHIHEIVAQQQGHAQMRGVLEILSPSELVEDALRLSAITLSRHGIEIVRAFAPVPTIVSDRHKILQILINLVQNAKEAMKQSDRPDKQLRIELAQVDDAVRFAVEDNGVGIPPENLTRIFNHGFTTRPGGHGFGLHASANAAGELGGSLVARSAGDGNGATFLLTIPLAHDPA